MTAHLFQIAFLHPLSTQDPQTHTPMIYTGPPDLPEPPTEPKEDPC